MADFMIPTDGLHRWIVSLFTAAGSSEREAQLTADHLVGANLAGHDSHGVGMAPRVSRAIVLFGKVAGSSAARSRAPSHVPAER